MRTRRRLLALIVLIVGIATGAASYTGGAAPQGQSLSDPLPALLAEVHALRIAMERNTAVAPRVQLTLARLNIEEQRIAQLAAQLDQVRRELAATLLEAQKVADRMPEIEKGLLTAADDRTKKGYEYEQEGVKRQLSAHSRQEQQLRARENEAAQALSTEQARWLELNARLDELERQLAPVLR
jgi:chromosome segregation ATPase